MENAGIVGSAPGKEGCSDARAPAEILQTKADVLQVIGNMYLWLAGDTERGLDETVTTENQPA